MKSLNAPLQLIEQQILHLATSPDISCESIGDRWSAFMDRLAELARRVRANVVNFNHDFKRSELKSFESHNQTRLRLFFHQPFGAIPSIAIPIPTQIKDPYHTAADSLITILDKQLDVAGIVTTLQSANGAIARLLKEESADSHKTLEAVYHQVNDTYTQLIASIEAGVASIVDPKPTLNQALASDVFKDKQSLRRSITTVEQFDDIFISADHFRHQYALVLKELDQLTLFVIHHPGYCTKDDLLYYSAIISQSARFFELYGTCLNLCQRIEHLFVESLKKILMAA